MKQARVTSHPVIHLWLLDAKYAYLKATLNTEDGKKMPREAKQKMITDCIQEVESTIESLKDLPQNKFDVCYAKLTDVIGQIVNLVTAIGRPNLAMPLVRRMIA